MTVYTTIIDKVQPVCSIPWVGQRLPWCSNASSSQTVDFTKLYSSQHDLEGVMGTTGRGLGLGMDMIRKEHAVRGLTVRVKHSGLACKDELGRELDSLVFLNTRTSE
jgi:hypothetical protein